MRVRRKRYGRKEILSRDHKKIVFESALSIFEQAAFEKYKEEKLFKELKQIVLKKGEKIC